jgi:Zn-finger nucleic acid-binding protein
LQPTTLDDGLWAHGCPQCSSALVALLYYRDWAERQPHNDELQVQVDVDAAHERLQALSGPSCARLMSKVQISGTHCRRLDLCGRCDEAWLVNGEWYLLKALALSHKMPSIFTEAWQRKARQHATEQARWQRVACLVGDEAVSRADEIRRGLNDHPQRRESLFCIGHQ